MNYPIYYYLIAAALLAIVVAAVGVQLRSRRPKRPSRDPSVDALRMLVNGDSDGAYEALQQVVRMGNAPVDAYIKLGQLLRERGQFARALQIHQSLTVKTTLSKPEKIELFMNLADDYEAMDNYEKAAGVLETAIRNLSIRDPEVFITLANLREKIGNNDKAYDALREAKKLGGVTDLELAHFLAASARPLIDAGDGKEARRILQRALKHDPKCAEAVVGLGDIAEREGDVDGAIVRWKEAALMSPLQGAALLPRLEATLFERGRFSDIEKIYDEVRASRWDEAATLALAQFYRKQGRGEEAIQLLEDFLHVHPESVRASLLLASFYAKYRDMETLEEFLNKTLSDSEQVPEDHMEIGNDG